MAGRRVAKRLRDRECRAFAGPGVLEDGDGLRLRVKKEGGPKQWVLRHSVAGKRVERGLGAYPTVSLDDARKAATRMREAAKEGRAEAHRVSVRKRQGVMTFRDAFEEMFAVRRQKLSNGKHVAQWQSLMGMYVYPTLEHRPIAEIEAGEILALLEPIWWTKPETAKRVLQRIGLTFQSVSSPLCLGH